jgi:hypothetical protein
MSTRQAQISISVPASADLSAKQYTFVTVNTSGLLVNTGDGAYAIGVLQDKPAAAGEVGEVAISGVVKVKAGGAITAGNAVASDLNGEAIVAASADIRLGVAMQDAAENDVISIVFNPAAAVA